MTVSTPTIGQLLGHYRIVERIGAGGMGVVFRAHDEQLDRDVALKTLPGLSSLSETSRRQFRREALNLARITDANVTMAFDFGNENGIDYLVTEFVSGLSLDAKIASRPLPESEIRNLGKQLASGLESAHAGGVIHRDLKPANLKITPEGKLKILDFGLAFLMRAESDTAPTAPLSSTFSDAGTVPYMSPEQLKGQTPDTRSDLWSAGAVLYEMSTAKRPFGERTGTALVAAILDQEPIPPKELNPKISDALERIILRALQKDPKERYQSAGDLRIDLTGLASGTAPVVSQSKVSSSSRLWAALALLLVVMLATAEWWWRHRAAPLSEGTMMAVLPFESVTNDSSANALGLGLTETLSAKMVQASDGSRLQLVSTRDLIAQGVRTSDQARREFGTDVVLEGSLQQEGSQVRITWNLVNPRTHTQLAANTITGDAGNIFSLQDKLFEEVIAKLPLAIDPGERQADHERPETNAAAYDLYLRGRGYLEEYQQLDNLENAISQFEHATAIDKNYAPAYAAMGMAYTIGFQQKNRGEDWINKAKASCEQALAIMPQLAEGHTCLGDVYYSRGSYTDAIGEFQRSLDLDHRSDETLRLLAASYQKTGNIAAAEDAFRKAVSLRPEYWAVYSAFGTFYFTQARYPEAAAMFQKAIERAPRNYRGYSNLGAINLLLGKYQEAVEGLKRSVELRPTAEAYGNLGAAYFYMHRYDESAESLRNALKIDDKDWLNWGNLGDTLYQNPAKRADAIASYSKAIELADARLQVNPRDAVALAFTADYYAMIEQQAKAREQMARALEITSTDADVLFRAAVMNNHFGDTEKSLDFLKRAVAAGYSPTVIRDTPDFDHLTGDPRFRALLPKA
jgi:serine/threonine protein kinase/Tfp pilus assembly protein PilF